MTKFLFALAASIGIANTAFAQITGLHLGYGIGTIAPYNSLKILTPTRTDSVSMSAMPGLRTSYGLGAFARWGYADLKPFFLQVELEGYYTKNRYSLTNSAGEIVSTFERNRFRIDVPVLAGLMIDFKKIVGLRIHAGLVPSFPFAEDSNKSFDVKWTEVFNNANIAYTYGAGLDIANRITLDLR
ncbi:MAG: hypothetical protein RI894_1744, partial [Bacteroidota bacterium]